MMTRFISKTLKLAIKIDLLLIICLCAVFADLPPDVKDISEQANADKFRFNFVGKDDLSDDLRKQLIEEDHIYLSDEPLGNVKVQVLDADTGKPIEDAQVYFAFSTRRNTVGTDGNAVQSANPFLLFDLGLTPNDGTLAFKHTYYYTTDKIEPGQAPFATNLNVTLAKILDEDPKVVFDYEATPPLKFDNPSGYETLIKGIDKGGTIPLSELMTRIKSIDANNYTEILRGLFSYDFARYSDATMVKVGNGPEFSELSEQQRKSLSIGDLRTYIADNRPLFIDYVAKRHFKDFGGFEPTFNIAHDPPHTYVQTYKDGTQVTKENQPYLGLGIFDEATGGTGYAVNVSFMGYRAYVYKEGYFSGKSMGSAFVQDLVDSDILGTVYLSRDQMPVSRNSKTSSLFGKVSDTSGQPIPKVSIEVIGSERRAVANDKGEYTLINLEDEKIVIQLIDPDNGQVLAGYATYNGQYYDLDALPIQLTKKTAGYPVNFFVGEKPPGTPPKSIDSNGSKIGLPLLIGGILGIGTICFLLWFFLVFKRKKDKPHDQKPNE